MKVAIIAKARNGAMIAYRQNFGLNQTEASKLAGVSIGIWCDLEGMKFNRVGIKSIDKIADMLGVHSNVIAPPELRGNHLKWAEIAFADIDHRYLLEHVGNPQLLSHQVEISPEELVRRDELKDKMSGVLMTLTLRQREILKSLFGFDGESCSMKEVAKVFGVTPDRVRQIKSAALRKLQDPARSGRLEGFLEKLSDSKTK